MAAGALAAALALALAGCASSSVPALPAVPTTVPPVPTTGSSNSGGAFLQSVAGVTTSTSVVLGPGTSGLNGVVTGPSGPVGGAVVEVDRVTQPGVSPATDRITTAADGSWSLTGILGGAYILRAWRAPDLAITESVSIFLSQGETRPVQMQMQQYTGMVVSSSMAPDPPLVGQPSNLVVLVTNTAVDANGVVRSVPVAGTEVELTGSDAWQVNTANPTTTDNNGEAAWQLTCTATGSQPLSITVNSATTETLDHVGACQVPPPITTTTTTTSGSGSSTTSTTSHH
ncbi:MAG TPA: carboxypeptidase-like regulatory domain-containing protein [Acidimicrobiales bacterium]|nr:carboxypeptidase-like regulatory domain-containing protein [Acidimicrobiales bacterium]